MMMTTTTTTVVKDEWVKAAMTDDSVVVELLVRLKQTQAATLVAKSAIAALRWGIRQPRSRSMRCDAIFHQGKERDSATTMRASPTTPLSWSGGGGAASPSGTVEAFEETSRQQTSGGRSKGIATHETTSNSTKRSRRKKTFAELKDEESFLLKERMHLKKEIETLRATFKEQSAKNENLKRMKLDLGLHSIKNPVENSCEAEKAVPSLVHERVACSHEYIPSTLPSHSSVVDHPTSGSIETQNAVLARNSPCFLPDLNMVPSDDDSGCETFYGMS